MTASIEDRVDVIVIGAGLAGIAAAHALGSQHPDKSFLVLDAYEGHGGTWRSHRYPGVRSDSDLFTYGFRFKPWTGAPVASGAEILDYMREAIEEYGLEEHFRYQTRVTRADWDSVASLWHIEGVHGPEEAAFRTSCSFLWMCQGYYRHSRGYTPDWPVLASFEGRIIHPQHWPEGFDYSGKRVIVIGSGATAATLVPAMARKAAHVTMLQRSPTYFSVAPNRHPLAETLRELKVDDAIVHDIVRRKITYDHDAYFHHIRSHPERAKAELIAALPAWLSKAEVEKHFTPAYYPWQQRLALTPDGDLFQAIRDGKATVVTDTIEKITPSGIQLTSGDALDADIIVTATGFELCMDGDIDFSLNGTPFRFEDTVSYRGIMFTSVPNLARSIGYLRLSSWTLRCELIADFVCRMLATLDRVGAQSIEVREPQSRTGRRPSKGEVLPFTASYARRGKSTLPMTGPTPEWEAQDYWDEKDSLPAIDFTAETFVLRGLDGQKVDSAKVAARPMSGSRTRPAIETGAA
ncbi:flavin-containing monooxygenase [Novosphingobium tardum]|uniref:Flavin-containing monooxygenase n=1 Tax=Novosphingobium tardum TaxID=1538021 RepID=A0ABV8RNI4_9SPHN